MKVFWFLGNLYFILLLRLVILLFICTNTLKSYLGDAVLVLPDLRGKQRQFKKKKDMTVIPVKGGLEEG